MKAKPFFISLSDTVPFMMFLFVLTVTDFGAVTNLNAQVAKKFTYQAVLRDPAGNVLKNTAAGIRFGFYQGSGSTTLIWEEEHAVVSNDMGLIHIIIGDDLAVKTGGTLDAFSEIDWTLGDYFMNVTLDIGDGSGYHNLGATQLLSVPFALYAGDVKNKDDADADPQNEIQDLRLSGDTLFISGNQNPLKIDLSAYRDSSEWVQVGTDTLRYPGSITIGGTQPYGSKLAIQGEDLNSDKPLFEVKRKDGQPVFAVYNEGVRIYVDTTAAKGPRGGFAIGGFGAKKGKAYEYLRVTPDSVRIYINPAIAKGNRGGFAIGGYGATKGSTVDYFNVSDQNTVVTTGANGRFQVNNELSGSVSSYLNLTRDNYFIGQDAGRDITTGIRNLFLGYNAGLSTTTGSYNSFTGYQAGYLNTVGSYNTFIGYRTGYNNVGTDTTGFQGNFNTFIGFKSGFSNTNGYYNVFLGYNSGYLNSTGAGNVFLGNNAGYSNNAYNNVFVGYSAGRYNTSGTSNVFLGNQTGQNNQTGNYNVYLGNVAGINNIDGSANIFIGDHAGYEITSDDRNIFFGYLAGMNFAGGGSNVIIGPMAGTNFDHGVNNVFIGSAAGYGGVQGDTGTGSDNVFIGSSAGANAVSAQKNIALGPAAGGALATGSNNVFLGYQAGYGTDGSDNVHIGYAAGYFETGSNTYYLDTKWRAGLAAQRASALMYGVFDDLPANQQLRINANVGIQAAPSGTYALYISGSAYASGGIWENSDVRMKKNVRTVNTPLERIMETHGVYFNWKKEDYPEYHFTDGTQVGFIAQELEKVFPELVRSDASGYKTVDYAKMTAILVEAMKQQQKMIEDQKERIEKLEEVLSKMNQ